MLYPPIQPYLNDIIIGIIYSKSVVRLLALSCEKVFNFFGKKILVISKLRSTNLL